MPICHIKIMVGEDKVDEFINTLRPLWFDFMREEGCSNYQIYRELRDERSFILTGEYDTQECLAEHLRSNHFQVLVGAAAVLGQSFKMSLAEVTETGGIEFARAQYSTFA